MLIITKRRKLGEICGHAIYGIAKSEMIPIPNTTVRSNLPYYQDENRSFVNSACKCNVYFVLLRRHKRVAFRNKHCLNVLDNCVSVDLWLYFFVLKLNCLVQIVCFSVSSSSGKALLQEVIFIRYLLIHLQCESNRMGFLGRD